MNSSKLLNEQLNAIVFMRFLIGWHFLYEGALKLFNPSWTAKGFLMSSQGPFENLFTWMAADNVLPIVDLLNMVGLAAIGLALILGYFERPAAIFGIIILSLYYLSHPPFSSLTQIGTEGNYWIVNKNLIEAAALLVIFKIPTADHFGLQSLLKKSSSTKKLQSHG
ncbi:MAG: DoxX subfamily [Flammeovirgaceae bacterium]|nr:DoxX subfamily [Flammeovirgaceae bacterium]MBE62350.1 DoxX subfamily [Flammeovirgaceae bacterium]HCX21211.1 DoxX subfamily [Cytophagales bacterium]|tara:strand:+ start:9428 stop:9925 length:498 start_codon:yes stop_codon:yes gene_type:complete